MPPEENKKIPEIEKVKVDIDPVFKGVDVKAKNTNQSTSQSAFRVLNNQEFVPSELKKSNPVENKPLPAHSSIIRTYNSDLAETIKKDHLSSVNIALAESQKNKNEQSIGQNTPVQNKSSSTVILIVISIILVLAGSATLVKLYIDQKNTPPPIVAPVELPTLITAEKKNKINIDSISPDNFIETIAENLGASTSNNGEVFNLNLTTGSSTAEKLISSNDFILLTRLAPPDSLTRNLLPSFMIGSFASSSGSNLPFLILKTSSIENTYAGMFNWEKNMRRDFEELFMLGSHDQNIEISSTSTPISTESFSDAVLANNDVRILRNENNQTELLYGIVDKQTVIITVNNIVFKEITNRLFNQKLLTR